jgi:hypothetical protein
MDPFNETFNTNPACYGVGPSQPAGKNFSIVQIAIVIPVGFLMLVTAVLLLYMRRYRRRIRIRSPLPVILGSFGGLIIIIIRASYDYIGREYLSCTLDVAMFYLLM